MAASSTLPVMNCRGYISTPWALGGQAHRTAPQASRNAWQFCPSSVITSCSNSSMLSLWDFSKVQAWIAWWTSTSIIPAAWQVCTSLTAAVQWTSASLMASVAQASFSCLTILVFSTRSLQWESMVTIVMSSCSKATFISPCS